MTAEVGALKRQARRMLRDVEETRRKMGDLAGGLRRWPDFPVAYWTFQRIRDDLAAAYNVTKDVRLSDLSDEATRLESELRNLVERTQPFMVAAADAYELHADETIKDLRAMAAASGLIA